MSQLILIVEDEPSIADNIAYALSTDGFAVEHKTIAGEALTVIREKPVDLVIAVAEHVQDPPFLRLLACQHNLFVSRRRA